MMDVIRIERQPRLTTYGAILQACKVSGADMMYVEQTPLNEKYNVFPDEAVDATAVPNIDYFGVGYGSTYSRPNAENIDEIVNYIHDPLDANLFHLLPLVIRDIGDDDLTPERRGNYAMRATFELDGATKIGYFLKAVDRSQSIITAEMVVPASTPGGVDDITTITGDSRYLAPEPTKLTTATQRKDGAYVRVRAPINMTFDAWEMNELINAKQIMTGSDQLEVTEIGLFSAIKKTKTVADGNNNITYTEAIKAQLNLASPLRFIANDRVGRTTTLVQDLGINNPTNFALPF